MSSSSTPSNSARAFSDDQRGRIARAAIQRIAEENGLLVLKPGVKRDTVNEAKKFGVEPWEHATFMKEVYAEAYQKVMKELDDVIRENK